MRTGDRLAQGLIFSGFRECTAGKWRGGEEHGKVSASRLHSTSFSAVQGVPIGPSTLSCLHPQTRDSEQLALPLYVLPFSRGS